MNKYALFEYITTFIVTKRYSKKINLKLRSIHISFHKEYLKRCIQAVTKGIHLEGNTCPIQLKLEQKARAIKGYLIY